MRPEHAERVETGLTIASCIAIARQVTVEQALDYADVADLAAERAHSLGPILDPTAYRRDGANADRVRAVARAFAELRRAIEEATP
jgi:hypothetical protein